MLNFRFSRIAAVFSFGLLFFHLPFLAGQAIPASLTEESIVKSDLIAPYKLSLSVNEVRLDVVVVDKKGRPITDLSAADFEISQDGQPQTTVSGVYINNQAAPAAQQAAPGKNALKLPLLPGKTLKEEDVSRTILFIVDNLSMLFEDLHYAKMSIKNFTEKQMQQGDMVAVMRTGYGTSALDFFSSDKRQIIARTESIPVQGLIDYDPRDPHIDPMRPCHGAYAQMVYDNQITALSYSIRALKDMPGRKILFLLTSCPALPDMLMPDTNHAMPSAGSGFLDLYGKYYDNGFNRMADEALRAGVVIHSLDTKGLEYYEPGSMRYREAQSEKRGSLNPMPAKTGGTYIANANFFLDGIGKDADNMIAGYYLISYEPPPSTFNLSRKNVYHRVKVKVKRKGATVYTRDGFYGRLEDEMDSAAPQVHPLQNAIFSPFRYADLSVNMAAGYVKDAKAGYLVRSWIHLDPKEVTITETENGGARIDLETVCLTSDIDGYVQDFVHNKYTLNIEPEKKSENIAWIKKHGIRFSLLLPIKKPGSYTVRIAVRDMVSDKVGSAYQSMEIPDLKKKGLALSNVFMITSADDLRWMTADVMAETSIGVFSLMFQEEDVRSPALRAYTTGDRLQTLAILYNADEKAIARSEIEMQSVMYKDGREFLRGQTVPIKLENAVNADGIPLLQRLTLGSDLTPGDYILQLLTIDTKNSKKKEGVAAETLMFTVVADKESVHEQAITTETESER